MFTGEFFQIFGLPTLAAFGLPFATTLWDRKWGFVVALILGLGILAIYLGFAATAEGQGGAFALVGIVFVGIPGFLISLAGWVSGVFIRWVRKKLKP